MEVETIARQRQPGESKPRAHASAVAALTIESRSAAPREALGLLETASRHLAIAVLGFRELIDPADSTADVVN